MNFIKKYKSELPLMYFYLSQVSPGLEVEDPAKIQTRPLPAPPAPTRSLKRGSHKRTPSPHAAGCLKHTTLHLFIKRISSKIEKII